MPSDRHPDRLYTITELAAELAVTPRAIRFYESKGLLAPQRAGANRVYDYRDRARLLIILRGKRLGFSLALIKQYLDLYDADPSHREQLVHLLRGARQRIDELEAQRRDLELTIEELREIADQVVAAMQASGIDPDASAGLPRARRRAVGERRAAQRQRGGARSAGASPLDGHPPQASRPAASVVRNPPVAPVEPDFDGGSTTP
jgi:DNA-binding transcriptional MerR regulator